MAHCCRRLILYNIKYFMVYNQMASAILNDVYSGLRGLHSNIALSVEQLEDEIPLVRSMLIKQYANKGILNTKDLMYAINCIPIDCKSLDRCPECVINDGFCPEEEIPHFEIPKIITELNVSGIEYIGSTDRQTPFYIYYTPSQLKSRKYKRWIKNKPYVYLDMVPNAEGNLDGYVFNSPLLDKISVVAMFKDLRDLEKYNCCNDIKINMSAIDFETQNILTEQKIKYYRQLQHPLIKNDQTPR